jgi:plasmid stabilization system protein ParE
MRILWTGAAVAQLEAIHDYMAQTSPEYARRIIDHLTKRSMQIVEGSARSYRKLIPDYLSDKRG